MTTIILLLFFDWCRASAIWNRNQKPISTHSIEPHSDDTLLPTTYSGRQKSAGTKRTHPQLLHSAFMTHSETFFFLLRHLHAANIAQSLRQSLELLMPSNNNHILLCLDNNICREKLLSLRNLECEAANASLHVVFNFWVCISRIQLSLFIYLRVYSAATFALNFMAIGRR